MTIQLVLTKAENLRHYGKKSGDIIALDLEREYMPICLSSEIYENNSKTPPEAKKAQAIACRTYILTFLRKGITINDTAMYQAFNWKALTDIPNCVQAVSQTEGEVLTAGGELITAWYSNSNGGETKRSDQAWSAYKPWTVNKPDPWDVAGRDKWGQASSSHGVGMSQIGAAYAASIGKSYREILMFYYPNTEIAQNYGEGSAQAAPPAPPPRSPEGKPLIPAQDLCAYGLSAVGGGYCYGASGEICSLAKRKEWAAWNPSQKTNLLGICAKWDGKRVWDCSGLFRGAWRTLLTYRAGGATTIFNTWCSRTGEIASMPDEPGIAVFRAGTGSTKQHMGLYIGEGMVVDARGSSYGVLHKPLDQFPWTHWGQLADVDYEGLRQPTTPPPPDTGTPYYGIVRTKTGGGIGLWTNNSKTQKIAQINDGQIVSVLSLPDAKAFVWASFGDQTGVVDAQYVFRTA